jgi:hypothetical protein
MSTDYCTSKKIRVTELLDGRLEAFAVRQHLNDETSAKRKCLTDGNNFLWTYVDDEGFVTCLTRYFPNGAPGKILAAISEAFGTDIFSEYQPQFWGFDTQEEWDAWQAAAAKESEDRFYAELVKYVSGEPNDINPGTIGEIKAKIAKTLVYEEPGLVAPDRRSELMQRIESVYDRDHAVRITLSDEDIALAQRLATHEDDLPQA